VGAYLKLLLVGLVPLVSAGCPPQPPTPVPPPGPATCADVCRHYAELGCDASKPTPEGAICTEVCENVRSSTVVVWDLDCRAHAPTCAKADACEAGH
jgi:hypothetical protein